MWIVLATVASAFWGLEYIFSEKVYKHVSVITALTFSYVIGTAVLLFLMFSSKVWKADIHTLATSRPAALYLAGSIITLLIADICIGLSISEKNATVAGLIEITYPIFIALFAYLFFRENEMNLGTLIGGICIFVGVAVIYLFNR
jgi:drug/metabolite transporter (DMT)-like permease